MSTDGNTPVVIQHFIGGAFMDASDGGTMEVKDPASNTVIGTLANGTAHDVNRAVAAAKAAFPAWSTTPTGQRSALLYRLADLIDRDLDALALAESRDQGKTVTQAKTIEIPRAAANFRFYAGAVLHHEDMASEIDGVAINYTVSQPVGVAGLISPWNLPLYLLSWKIAPAIATGNTCVCKPSEVTSLTAFMLCKLIQEAGIPDGVVNMVFGAGNPAGAALVSHSDVPLVSFTGGTATGERIALACAPRQKKLSLELGGKNPTIVFDDANLDDAVAGCVRASFANQGEICLCGERIYVQEGIFDAFMEQFITQTKALKIGDPRATDTKVGPLVSAEHLAKVKACVAAAVDQGATIVCGEEPLPDVGDELRDGNWFRPTVLIGAKPHDTIQQEEVFGPVVTVTRFETEEEVIGLANDVAYGLSASVWSQNIGTANRVALALQCGTVWVNCWLMRDLRVPFGGWKASGVGREGGKYALEFYTEQKAICVKYRL